MRLKDIVSLYDGEMFISQDSQQGVTGSSPVFHYSLTSGKIPEQILEREVAHFEPIPIVKYGRNSSALSVHLVGYVPA